MIAKPEHQEGRVASMIEEQTAKVPSDVFLWAGLGTMVAAAALHMSGKKSASALVGQVGPALLIMGLYNKIVKIHGHD